MRTVFSVVVLQVMLLGAAAQPSQARTLEEIRQSGALTLCVYPNLLPFSSDRDDPPGIHVELGREIAAALGVRLEVSWIVPRSRRKAGVCDVGFDEVEGQEVKGYGISVTRPYLRTGVALLVRQSAGVHGYADLAPRHRIGAPHGSEGEAYLRSRGLQPRTFAIAQEMERAFRAGELDAILVPAHATAYALRLAPQLDAQLLHAYRDEPRLAWNLVVVLRKADAACVDAVNTALERAAGSGRLAALYERYGIPYLAPRVD